MNILVINSGSSSIKYRLFDMTDSTVLAAGLVEQIGESTSRLTHRTRRDDGGIDELVQIDPLADHEEGFDQILKAFADTGLLKESDDLCGIGHRVVHGGEAFQEPTLITDEVIETIREQIPLAPLHNPANLTGIEVTFARMPQTLQVAVFDTAFHQTIPPHAFHYALPRDLASAYSVRRFGFHGTSHQYVTKAAAEFLKKPLKDLNLITCHLGNGASVCAVRGGRSIDTSMGMTPLEGLIMGTRSGDIDPGVIFYLGRKARMSLDQLDALLNQRSGMKGVCGVNDMREIEDMAQGGDQLARLALDMYGYRLKKYIGMYRAVLGRVDALVFTAGIGENSPVVRACACADLDTLGVRLDPEKNEAKGERIREIQADDSTVKVLVIPTNEELEIAQQAFACIDANR
jgi:acetate kinase